MVTCIAKFKKLEGEATASEDVRADIADGLGSAAESGVPANSSFTAEAATPRAVPPEVEYTLEICEECLGVNLEMDLAIEVAVADFVRLLYRSDRSMFALMLSLRTSPSIQR